MKKISTVITAYRLEANLKPDELAMCIGLSHNAFYTRLRDGKSWRLGELKTAYDFLNVPSTERIYEEE